MSRPVDPRTEADAQVARALQVVVDADEAEAERGGAARARRDYTPDELETLFFTLGMAIVQLKKLPGGQEAHDRGIRRMREELGKRGRHDLLARLDAESELRGAMRALDELGVPAFAPEGSPVSAGQPLGVEARIRWVAELARRRQAPEANNEEAVRIVRRTFGDDVDLSEGTTGHHLVKLVELELAQLQQLGEKLVALAVQVHPWKEGAPR